MAQRRSRSFSLPFLALALALGSSACASRRTALRPVSSAVISQAPDEESLPALTPDVSVEEARLRGKEFVEAPAFKNVPFDYDSYTLSPEAREILKANAQALKGQPDLEVLLAGHCDQRGTLEYNLALGQKRAKEVREFYIRLGIGGKSIATISYGKERPLCQDETEPCWSKNRRVETRVRSRTVSNGTSHPHP